MSATPGERRFDIELARARLRFLDADGTALARQQIGLFLPRSGGDGWSPFRGSEADDEGALEFTLVPGRYGFARGSLLDPDRVIVPLDWTATGPLVDELRL